MGTDAMKNILVLVGNASRARILNVQGRAVSLLDDLTHPASRAKGRDLASDKPGRAFDDSGGGAGPQRSAMEPPTDPHEVEVGIFAREVARRLSIHARRGRFPELLLLAPPRFLGRVKAALEPAIARRIVASVSHDYTAKTDEELLAILTEMGAVSEPA
jgi:protein required for attachment to host cells